MRVGIYKSTANGAPAWVVSRQEGGKRKRSFFHSKEQAEIEASRLRSELANVGEAWINLTRAERQSLILAHLEAKERGLDLYALAKAPPAGALGDGPMLQAVVDELIAAKRKAGRADDYTDSLDRILGWFAGANSGLRIGRVGLAEVESFLDSKPPASRSTLQARLSTLFQFAVRRGYRIDNPCARLETVTRAHEPPRILAVEQVETCLRALAAERKPSKYSPIVSYRHALPWFVLSTFCGLRPEEAEQTRRADIHIKEGWIKVEAQTTKVRQRRVVQPKSEAMALLARTLRHGRLPIDWQARRRAIRVMRDALGWDAWPKDVTRHTAASYWLADCQDAAAVAASLGHSEAMLHKHYKALVTRADAKRFWAITFPMPT